MNREYISHKRFPTSIYIFKSISNIDIITIVVSYYDVHEISNVLYNNDMYIGKSFLW